MADWLRRLTLDRSDDPVASRSRALVIRTNEYGYDPFGLHRSAVEAGARVARWIYEHYFRVESFGVEHIPATGRAIFVANHSGQLPFDGMMICAAAFFEAKVPRLVRAMIEHFVPSLPFVSYVMPRLGQIVGTPDNCRTLLRADEAILVFPEGAKGIAKPFARRYQLEGFGSGFLRLALETGSPIIPVAVIGAEEQAPALNLKRLARVLGLPSFPVVPYPPFVPLLPLPVKYRIYFGEPMKVEGDADDDDEQLEERVRAVKHRIQSMLHAGLRERRHVFW